MNYKILSLSGYFNRHFELCRDCKTQEDAYDMLEDELKKLHEHLEIPYKARYTSYESFRMNKSRFYKMHRE
jgi:hypothetical protein